ncbi:helix-turn-helix domain-containing protein [Treponema sp. OMZ 857]|uniref:helix-turn-helix domain-containing protein n=1 Tax=Treponema sp. OMZ 857 TaxID=1643513 RepID=UPI0020A24717|nr:helix-turn-helix transcriptional regulator [Treponema sp. OMZ 857]
MNKEVGDTIRELRKEKHLSQEKLADVIDSHQVYISEIEKGIKLPSLTIINNIAKAFDISLTQFISRVEKKLKKGDTQEPSKNI